MKTVVELFVTCKECGWQELHDGEVQPVRYPHTNTDSCPECSKTKCFELLPEYSCLECRDSGEIKGSGCPECCEHNEHDHYICLDCGHEGEPSDYYDEDYGLER